MTVAGIWGNEYGSRMTLASRGDGIFGIYESTTGSVGKYLVTGWQLDAEPVAGAGQPVALAIEWHSIVAGLPDASWNWVSALGGQISLVGGQEALILSHLLVASSGFDGLCGHGIHTDKLTYHRVGDATPPQMSARQGAPAMQDPLAGEWLAAEGARLDLVVSPDTQGRFGYLSGTMVLDGATLTLAGFTDVNAAQDGLARQSVSIVAKDESRGVTLAFGGWIELVTGVVTVHRLTSRITTAANAYAQTDIWPMEFRRPVQQSSQTR
jgi:hypothetical protein